MTMQDKFQIAMAAKNLIYLLEECDDSDFVDLVINSVANADVESLDLGNL